MMLTLSLGDMDSLIGGTLSVHVILEEAGQISGGVLLKKIV